MALLWSVKRSKFSVRTGVCRDSRSTPFFFSGYREKLNNGFLTVSFLWSSFVSLSHQEPVTSLSLSLSLFLCVCVRARKETKLLLAINHHQNFGLYRSFVCFYVFTFANCIDNWIRLLHPGPPVCTVFEAYNGALVLLLKSSAADPWFHLYDIFLFPFVSVYSLKTLMMTLFMLISLKQNVALY